MANLKSLVGIEAPEFKGNFSGGAVLSNGSTTYTTDTSTNNDEIASTKFVHNVVAELVDSAPDTLDTLSELAKALGNDDNFATNVSTELGKKLNKSDIKIEDDGLGNLTLVGMMDE